MENLEILSKYESDFIKSIVKLNYEKERFGKELKKFSEFSVHNGCANYFMIDLKSIDSDLFCELAYNNGIIIRNLKKTTHTNSIRISIRNKKDNNNLIRVFSNILKLYE